MTGFGTSPTSRALLALEVLQARPGITAEALGDRLGVSDRAARRYVGMLREAGIPVESERGPYGGYRLGRGLRMPPVTFDAGEALGLVMAVLDGHHPASDPDDPVGRALGKLLRSLPAHVATRAEAVRRTTAAAPDRSAARPDPQIAASVVDACSAGRRLRIAYRSEGGSEWTTEIEPWAVVVRHGRWYVLCVDVTRDERRAYRIDRIASAEPTDATFAPPDGLDPVAALEEHLSLGWEHECEVVVDAPVDVVAPVIAPALGRLEAIDAASCRLVGSTSNPAWYAESLARIPAPFRIVGGDELRAAVAAIGRRLADASG